MVGAGLICIIGAVVIKIVMQALNRLVVKLPLDKAMLGFLTAAARIVMVIVLATMVAGQLNVPITSLVALLSLFALAVSLSVQDVLANVVSGMVILIAKPFVAGNFISTQNAEGTVERIGLMYTHLVTADNKAVMIPNKEISTERIINYTAKDYRRVDVKLCIGSEIDTDAVLDALAAACKRAEEGREAIKPPFVGISAYQAGGIRRRARLCADGGVLGRLLSVHAADSAGADGAKDRRAVGFDLHQERRRIKAGDFFVKMKGLSS